MRTLNCVCIDVAQCSCNMCPRVSARTWQINVDAFVSSQIKSHPRDKCGHGWASGRHLQTDGRNGCPDANFYPKTSIMTTLLCTFPTSTWGTTRTLLGLTPKGPRQPKWLFAVLGKPLWMHFIFGILKLFLLVNMDGSFLVSCSMQHLDSRFMSKSILKISAYLWACSQPLLMQQFCPKLPKSA